MARLVDALQFYKLR